MNKFLRIFYAEADDGNGGEPKPEIKPEVKPNQDETSKTFTQDELNTLLANEKKSAKAKVLKELGVDDAETIKALLKKQKEDEDNNKTASEKLESQNKILEDANNELSEYKARDKAIELDVDPSKAKEFIKLAKNVGEGETIEDKIKDTLTKYPFYKSGVNPPKFGTKTGGKPNTLDDDLATVKKYMNM